MAQVNATVKAPYLGEFVDDALEGANSPLPSAGVSEIVPTTFLDEFADDAEGIAEARTSAGAAVVLTEDQVRVLKELISRWTTATEVIAARPLRTDLARSGLTDFRTGLALAGLELKGMIRSGHGQGWDEKHDRPAALPGFLVTGKGVRWLEENVASCHSST